MTETKVVRIKKSAEEVALKYGETVSQGILEMENTIAKATLPTPTLSRTASQDPRY
jgi:hypothetical protein